MVEDLRFWDLVERVGFRENVSHSFLGGFSVLFLDPGGDPVPVDGNEVWLAAGDVVGHLLSGEEVV